MENIIFEVVGGIGKNIVATAVPKKVYNEATLVPYNPNTGEITDDGRFNIRCEDVTTAMQTNSALALAFNVIIDTINALSKDPTMLNG